MEPLVLRPRIADPGAVFALGHRIPDAANIQKYGVGLGRFNACPNRTLGIDLGILTPRLIG